MSLFHHNDNCKECKDEVKRLLGIIETQAKIIYALTHTTPHPVKLSIKFSNNNNSTSMSLELKSGQSSIGTLVVTDTVTNQPVSATFTNLVATSDNPAVATITPNADGTVTAVGVSAGTANVNVSAIAAFTNSLGNADSQALNFSDVVTVDAVPVAHPVSLSINWGTPT